MADENGATRILLACGIGASTGFMAASMRKYAKSEGLNVTISAVSKSEIMDQSPFARWGWNPAPRPV